MFDLRSLYDHSELVTQWIWRLTKYVTIAIMQFYIFAQSAIRKWSFVFTKADGISFLKIRDNYVKNPRYTNRLSVSANFFPSHRYEMIFCSNEIPSPIFRNSLIYTNQRKPISISYLQDDNYIYLVTQSRNPPPQKKILEQIDFHILLQCGLWNILLHDCFPISRENGPRNLEQNYTGGGKTFSHLSFYFCKVEYGLCGIVYRVGGLT